MAMSWVGQNFGNAAPCRRLFGLRKYLLTEKHDDGNDNEDDGDGARSPEKQGHLWPKKTTTTTTTKMFPLPKHVPT